VDLVADLEIQISHDHLDLSEIKTKIYEQTPQQTNTTKPFVAFGNETFKLNLKTRTTNTTITLGI
jgi:hypothetical protein